MKNLTNRSTNLLYTIFLFTFFSGVFRKWIFPSPAIGNIIFFFQIVIPFIFFFNGLDRFRKIFSNLLVTILLFTLLFSCVNPLQKTLYHGAIGLIFHFSIWFLMIYYIENKLLFNLEKLNKPFLILIVAQLTLAFIQYKSPQTAFINRYSSEQNVGGIIAEVGNAVRVTGTFSYISGFSAFLLFHVLFTWSLIIKDYKPQLTLSLLFFGLIACFMNGSRGTTYIYLFINAIFFFFEARKTNITKQSSKIVIPFLLLLGIFLNSGSNNFGSTISNSISNFQSRRSGLAESGEETNRIFGDYYSLKNFRGNYPYFGIGIGSAYQGNTILFGSSDALIEYGFIESELEKYVLEGGFFLLFIRILLTVNICQRLYLPNMIKILFGGLFFLTPVIYNVFNIIFLFIGVIFIDQAYYKKYNSNRFESTSHS